MVFESLASLFLNKYLQKFFFGINSQNIQVSILDGKFVLSNIGLQPTLVTNLNLPIELRYSYVQRVEINIPWRQDEVSLTVNMSNIYMLLTDAGSNFNERNIFMKGKENAISGALKEFKDNLERENSKELGYFEKIFLNLLDNVNIRIESIHVRYENRQKNYSFGIKINEVSARTVDSKDQPTYFNRQKTKEEYVRYVLKLGFMGIYFNSKEDYFLCNKTSAEITDEFNRISSTKAQQNMDFEDHVDSFDYVLTIALKTHLKKCINALEGLNEGVNNEVKKGKYLFECHIGLNKIESRVTHEQYEDILDLITGFTQYQKTYQQYANEHHYINYREKRAKQIMDLIKKKKAKNILNKKEKELLSANCQKYFTWLFRAAREESMKRMFIKQAIKKEITIEKLKKNRKTMRIMEKTQNDKLKYWVLIALYYRKKYEDKVNSLLRSSKDKIQHFANKYIDSHDYFEQCEFETQINRMRQASPTSKFQVFLKMTASIQELTFQISKESVFGVSFNVTALKASLIVREKNYQLTFNMKDFAANVFNCKKSQKSKTYVPIIRRNVVYEEDSSELLEIKYERNPIGKPFVFQEVQINFDSIEVTIYPEAFRQFYQILLGEKDSQKKDKTKNQKKKISKQFKSDGLNDSVRHFRLQRTIVKGKVKSPWVVLPLSTNNDMRKECWVVRLGDFFINTPEVPPANSEEQLYYEHYRLEMKRFELNYFSSIHYFHNWQKYNQNLESLAKIRSYAKEKILTMIEPFSCFVDFSVLRSNLPDSIRNKKHRFVARLILDEVNIKISKFLLTKMKYRFDVFDQTGHQQLGDFIETNVVNIKQENELAGYCKISYDKINKLTLFCVLKDDFMYFFPNENHPKYHFFVNVTEVAIRLISNEVQNINTQKKQRLCFYLNDVQKHRLWRKKIVHVINRKERKFDNTFMGSFGRRSSNIQSKQDIRTTNMNATNLRQTNLLIGTTNFRQSMMDLNYGQFADSMKDSLKQPTLKELNLHKTVSPTPQLGSHSSNIEEEEIEQTSSSLKLNTTFFMNKLSIKLLDEQDKQFLDCQFSKVTFVYEVLRSKQMHFTLNQWIVTQSAENQPFVSSNAFISQDKEPQKNMNLNNFLEIRFIFNQFTQELQRIKIDVDKLFVAWKVELFTKILLYFFYEEEAGDSPSPSSTNKKQLEVLMRFQQLTFYAYFNEELIAHGNLIDIAVMYAQSNIEERYQLKCKIFEMDKYVRNTHHSGNQQDKKEYRLPMIKRRYDDIDGYRRQNNLSLNYVVRKQETQQVENIERLKKKLGKDLVVSQIFCEWKDTIIYFENQLTFRLLNYILNKILGTVAAKFKKREYSPNYIFETLKSRKVSAFDVRLINFEFRMPPHQRGFRQFSLDVEQMRVTKNLDDDYLPTEIKVKTIRHTLAFLWESMIIHISKAKLSYCVGQEPGLPLHSAPFDLHIIYSKLNFSRQYYVILNTPDDIDRKTMLQLTIDDPVIVDAHKIMFVTFLQLFYQNIKHKDGLDEKFEPSLPYPSLKNYNIRIKKIGFNMYRYLSEEKAMKPYSFSTVQQFTMNYIQKGPISQINLNFKSVQSKGHLPIYPLDQDKKKFSILVSSEIGPMKLVLNIEHYALEVNLDALGDVIDFLDFDSQYVSNKLMPKKSSSWMYVNVFAKNCVLKLGQLHATGEFYISYLKGMKNEIELEAQNYLLSEEEMKKAEKGQLNWSTLTDKEIKVNGQDLKLSINGDHIGGAINMCFNRMEVSNKTTNRRYKKERVQIGQGMLYIQLIDLTTIWKVFNNHIRKSPKYVPLTYYEPWDLIEPKPKSILKRCTEVEIQKLAINLISNSTPESLLFMRIDLSFPLISLKTYLVEEQIQVNLKFNIWHNKEKIKQTEIASCKMLKLRYTTFKDRKQKWIEIPTIKNVRLLFNEINNKTIADVLEQARQLKNTQRKEIAYASESKQILKYDYVFKNETANKITLEISNGLSVTCEANTVITKTGRIDRILDLLNKNSHISITQNNAITQKASKDINLYQPTQFNKKMLVIIPEIKKTTFIYRPPYQMTNKTSGIIIVPHDKKIIRSQEVVSLMPTSNFVDIQLKINSWAQSCSVDVRKAQQLIGDQCFVATVSKKGEDTIISIVDRYTIKNTLPVPIMIRNKEIVVYGELSLGYIPASERQKIQVSVDGTTLAFNLAKQEKKVSYKKNLPLNTTKSQYSSVSCEIHFLYGKEKLRQFITVYCEYGIRNNSESRIGYTWGHQQFLLKEKQSMILPASFNSLKFNEHGASIQASTKSKDNIFYGSYLQFTRLSRLEDRSHLIKIQSKFTFVNNSNELIEIKGNGSSIYLMPYQMGQINSNIISNQTITVVFGKYHERKINLQHLGVNYLQLEDIFFKISVIKKYESTMVLLQDAEKGHSIVNKTSDLTILARAWVQAPVRASQGMLEEQQNQNRITTVIKPGEAETVGLMTWEDQLIQLQFYYQAKNIEFKERYLINFNEMSPKYSVKHTVHQEKEHKLIFAIILTFQKDSEGRYTVSVYKEKDYENTPYQKLKVNVQEASCSFGFGNSQLTLQCYKLGVIRQKGVQMQDIDLQVQKLLIREGKNISILSALNQGKFLNCHVILNKTLRGTFINNLMLKVIPIELICREKVIFMILEKIVEIRAQITAKRKGKGAGELVAEEAPKDINILHNSLEFVPQPSHFEHFDHQMVSAFKQRKNEEEKCLEISKEWQKQVQKLMKGKPIFIMTNMVLSETSIFVSYSKEQYRSADDKIGNDPIIKYMLLIPSISELKIAIPHLKISDFEGQSKGFAKELLRRLRQSIGATVMSSFSSLPLFDNPIIVADGIFKYIEGILSMQ